MEANRAESGRAIRAAGWGVHLLTATGAVCGLLALGAVAAQEYGRAFVWMGIALLIDGADGTLARVVGVRRNLPSIDGALLDNIVDYLNYAVVPAFLLYSGPALPPSSRVWAASAVCLAAAYQFSHAQAKLGGRYFRGFPSYWNIVAFYLVLLAPAPRAALAIVALLVLLSFVPSLWVYPSRTPEWRRTTLALTVLWLGCLALLLHRYPEPPGWLIRCSLFYPLYYVALSLALTWRHRGVPARGPFAPPP